MTTTDSKTKSTKPTNGKRKAQQRDKSEQVPAAPAEDGATTNRHLDIRRFRLKRIEDETGMSGTGYVAEGIQFSNGTCVIRWLTATSSIGVYHSHPDMIHIHGHGGKTVIEWIDEGFTS